MVINGVAFTVPFGFTIFIFPLFLPQKGVHHLLDEQYLQAKINHLQIIVIQRFAHL
jgi:hypothetical protein